MTNQELKELAKVLGWTELQMSTLYSLTTDKQGKTVSDLVGRPPGYEPYLDLERVPKWFKDLPACMGEGGPWEWLILGGHSLKGEFGSTGAGEPWVEFQVLVADPEDNHNTLAILPSGIDYFRGPMAPTTCEAVLAVAKKLKE